jgi:membrane-associated phospholipid phosphatase
MNSKSTLSAWLFILITVIFCIWVIWYGTNHEKGDLIIFFNEHRNLYFTDWNIFITKWGEEISYIIFGLLLMIFNKIKYGFVMALVGGVVTAVSYLLKTYFSMPRPMKYFELINELCLLSPIAGIPHYMAHNSFPSGHTMSAFALFGLLSFIYRKPILSVFFVGISIFVAISRVYLNHHFIEDVGAGAFAGMILAYLMWLFSERTLRFNKKHWMEKPILHRKLLN